MLKIIKILTITILLSCAGNKDYIKNNIDAQVEEAKVVVTESKSLTTAEKTIINSTLRSCQATIAEYSNAAMEKDKVIAGLKSDLATCAKAKEDLQKEKAALAADAGFVSTSREFFYILGTILALIVILIVILKAKGISLNPLSLLGK